MHQQKLLECGLKGLLNSFKTALRIPTGMFLNTRTWKSKLQLSWVTSHIVWTQSQMRRKYKSTPTRSPG